MSRNKESNERLKEERRQKILSGALRLFATRGLAATKISDIARETTMSQGLVYHYFDSKEEIFVALIRTAFERLNGACESLEKLSASPKEKVLMAIEGLLKGLEENEEAPLFPLLIAQATPSESIPAEARLLIDEQNKVPYEVMRRILEQGQKEGEIMRHDATELSILFWTTINGLAIYKSSHGAKSITPDTSLITRMFFA